MAMRNGPDFDGVAFDGIESAEFAQEVNPCVEQLKKLPPEIEALFKQMEGVNA